LPTAAHALPEDAVEALRAFCDGSPGVATGYVCAIERKRAGEQPSRGLSFCVKLTTLVGAPGDSGEANRLLAQRLARSHPELMQQVGCGVLADRAVPAWEQHALRVFARKTPG
jgi:hypothetical protein